MKNPTFKEYHLFFLGQISDVEIRRLASLDESDVVKNVQRIYANYFAINEDLFHCGCDSNFSSSNQNLESFRQKSFDMMEEGLLSAILSFRTLPDIRYLKDSQDCVTLASRVSSKLKQLRMKMPREFNQSQSVVLILERREDPLTPLALDWSYQSLISEMGDFKDNKIKIANEEFNLNLTHDVFYRENRTKNYGDLTQNLNKMMNKFSEQKNQSKQLENFEDMQKALHQMPEFKKESANIKKHYSIVTEITKQVNGRQLLDISQLEQDILVKSSVKEHLKEALVFIKDPKIANYDKLRLSSIFCLKYEGTTQSQQIIQTLVDNCSAEDGQEFANLIEKLLRKSGKSSRILNKGGTSGFGKTAKDFYKDFFGVSSVIIYRKIQPIYMNNMFHLYLML